MDLFLKTELLMKKDSQQFFKTPLKTLLNLPSVNA